MGQRPPLDGASQLRLQGAAGKERGGWAGRARRPAPEAQPSSPDYATVVETKFRKLFQPFRGFTTLRRRQERGEQRRPARRTRIRPPAGSEGKWGGGRVSWARRDGGGKRRELCTARLFSYRSCRWKGSRGRFFTLLCRVPVSQHCPALLPRSAC